MQSVMIVLMGVAGMSFGWFVYSKFIAEKIYRLDPDFVTPAHALNDGVDFHPTNKYVLWGHHFTSVAGAAPIVGPAIAVYWGWVPAVLWVMFGTIFFAGVHDFGALWASARQQGPIDRRAFRDRHRQADPLAVHGRHLPRAADGQCRLRRGHRKRLRRHAELRLPGMVRDRGRIGHRPARAPQVQPAGAVDRSA